MVEPAEELVFGDVVVLLALLVACFVRPGSRRNDVDDAVLLGEPVGDRALADAGKGWRVLDRMHKGWWGEIYKVYPDRLLIELNGPKRPDAIVKLVKELKRQ